jgi:hypothetical protein
MTSTVNGADEGVLIKKHLFFPVTSDGRDEPSALSSNASARSARATQEADECIIISRR